MFDKKEWQRAWDATRPPRVLTTEQRERQRVYNATYVRKPEVKARRAVLLRGYRTSPYYKQKHAAKEKIWRDSPHGKLRVRAYRLKRKYELTLDQWNLLFDEQNNCCKTCQTLEPGKNGWAVDHNHDTGKVRGILCCHCNLALGHVKDSPERLKALITYLEAHNE